MKRRNHCESKESKTFLYKQVYQDLKDRIYSGEFLSNALLPSEREIGEHYHVDRTTVRKALQMLVDEQLVEKCPGKGTLVIWRQKASETVLQNSYSSDKKGMSIAFFFQKTAVAFHVLPSPFIPSYSIRQNKNARDGGIRLSTLP